MSFNYLIFKCNHPLLNIDFYLLGVNHEMQYKELSLNCKKLLESADIVFHEGVNGVVFLDPDWQPRLSYVQPHDSNAWWLDQISDEQRAMAQKILNIYFINVKRASVVPNIRAIQPWAIMELMDHLTYFARGNEIDHTLYYKRRIKNQTTICLDEVFLTNRLEEKLKEWTEIKATNTFCFYYQKIQDEINNFLTTGTLELESTDDFGSTWLQRILNITETCNDFCRESPEYITDRNLRWIEILRKHFKENIQTKITTKINTVLVCGAGHLPDLIARLICEGFEVSKDIQNEKCFNFSPVSKQEKGLFFAFELEKKTFSDLRSQIIKKEIQPRWLEEIISLTKWNKWQEDYNKTNKNKTKNGYGPGALISHIKHFV